MPYPVPTSFTKYHLTQEEEKNGQTLTQNNICVIQNMIADFADRRLNIAFNPLNPIAFAQEEAELKGQIGILKHLLEVSQLVSPTHLIG